MVRVTEILSLIVALVASICLILLRIAPASGQSVSGFFTESGFVAGVSFLFAVAVLALNVYVIVTRAKHCDSCRQIEIVTDNGVNRISVHALEAQLLDELVSETDVSAAKIALEVRGENQPVRGSLSFKLTRQANVTGRSDELKKKVRDAFDRILSGKASLDLSANVLDLLPEKKSVDAGKTPSEFYGPVYPDHEEESRS